jgi:hypothetical protein
MLGIPISPLTTEAGNGVDPIVGIAMLVVVLGLSAWAIVVSIRGRGRIARPTGVTRLRPAAVH